jgi:hypothetical protein
MGLVDAAFSGVRILYCTRCRGMLIGMEVFAALVQTLRNGQEGGIAPKAPDRSELDRRLNCPHCHQAMDTGHFYCERARSRQRDSALEKTASAARISSPEMAIYNWLTDATFAQNTGQAELIIFLQTCGIAHASPDKERTTAQANPKPPAMKTERSGLPWPIYPRTRSGHPGASITSYWFS